MTNYYVDKEKKCYNQVLRFHHGGQGACGGLKKPKQFQV